jgi:chemotaxis protein methyltransferase CheR
LSDAAALEQFRELIARALGLRVDAGGPADLWRLLRARAQALGLRSEREYLRRLATCGSPSDAEWLAVAAELTVGETFFWRGIDQLQVLRAVLAQRAGEGGAARVLCAGCASGEEPYSVAIAACEWFGPGHGAQILAVDASERSLARARAGRYSRWSLRETPAQIRSRYFEAEGQSVLLCAGPRAAVRFEQQNLADPKAPVWNDGPFDAVLCRNVLMYFTPQALRDAVERIAAVLTPAGVFLLGHAETLRGVSERFELQQSEGAFFYRLRGGASAQCVRASPRTPAAAPAAAPLPAPVPAAASVPAAAPEPAAAPLPAAGPLPEAWLDLVREALLRAELGGAAAAVPLSLQSASRGGVAAPARSGALAREGDADRLLRRAMQLADGGDTAAAESACAELLALDDLSANAHFVLALCREQRRESAAAIEHMRIASYLAPQFALPHLHLGLLLRRRGERDSARRELALAAELLAREDAARLQLLGSGLQRTQLIELCRAEAARCADPAGG